MAEQRDPRVDPRAGDIVEVKDGVRYAVSGCSDTGLVSYVYWSSDGRNPSGFKFHCLLATWRLRTQGKHVIHTSEEPAHAD